MFFLLCQSGWAEKNAVSGKDDSPQSPTGRILFQLRRQQMETTPSNNVQQCQLQRVL